MKFMKMTFITVLLMGITATSQAGLNVSWNTPSGFLQNDGITPLLQNGNALFQLWFSDDNIANEAAPGGVVFGLGDRLLEQIVVSSAEADVTGNFFSDTYSEAFSAGFVYLRVFDTGSSIGSPAVGTYYFTGPTFAALDTSPPAANMEVNEGPTFGGPGPFGEFVLNTQIVPEPSTLAFLGIGGLVLAMRRRKA